MDLDRQQYGGGVRLALRTQSHVQTSVKIYSYGEDPRVPNPGDLLLIAEYGSPADLTELALLLRGKNMKQLLPIVERAEELYAENEDWLSAPASWDPASGQPRPAWSTERKSA